MTAVTAVTARTATLPLAPPTDAFVCELDEIAVTAGALPAGAVAALRRVIESLLADGLEPDQREAALRSLAALPAPA